jgi:hypothetical protein
MSDPYLYKRICEEIIYHIQTKLQTHLPDELRHDIYANVLQAVLTEIAEREKWNDNWYNAYLELKKKGFPKKWNELRLKLARYDELIDPDEILEWMHLLDDTEYIRDKFLVKTK